MQVPTDGVCVCVNHPVAASLRPFFALLTSRVHVLLEGHARVVFRGALCARQFRLGAFWRGYSVMMNCVWELLECKFFSLYKSCKEA